ncbi:hypothetical protein EDB87DRAFT_1833972 [Lactarius vividus]|nr:hypothetical protein EDB87DRAFT_1833972 [Lactarius vividus]
MLRFAVVLFALIALFAIVPSSASALSGVKRETNADRFARGLPPMPPTRRSTAKRQQNSPVPRSGRIQVRDHGNGNPHGYLQNGPSGPGGVNHNDKSDYTDLNVIYNPAEKSIYCLGSHFTGNGFYLGAPDSSDLLGDHSTAFVIVTNVEKDISTAQAGIWIIDAVTGNNVLALVGDPDDFISQNQGWQLVLITLHYGHSQGLETITRGYGPGLFVFSSVLPLALARAETNADRFKRGAPPLPPTRRDSANRADPSSRPPPTVSGHLVVRDITGRQVLGYMQNSDSRSPIIGVSPLNSPQSARLQATYSGSAHTLVATNALFPAPYFLGSQFPYFNDPGASPPEEILFTNVVESRNYSQLTHSWRESLELPEVYARVNEQVHIIIHIALALPKPSGGSVQAVFAWDTLQNALELVTDVPTYLAAAWESEPHDQQPVLVRLFFENVD